MLILMLLLSLEPGITVENLEDGTLHWRETDQGSHEICIALSGEQVSGWVSYPLFFNPAKLYCEYSTGGTLEVISQLPYTADFTFAWYLVDDDMQLTLYDEGEGDYYGGLRRRVQDLLDKGYLEDAASEAMSMMYPGALPFPDEFCAMFVIAAAESGTAGSFSVASDITGYLLYCGIEDIDNDSEEFLEALQVYYDVTERNMYED